MIDGCGREIDHLRLSLTDRCNLACRYCTPVNSRMRGGAIEASFAFEIVRWLSGRHGIRYLRLTGGEPLVYPKLLPLIERLSKLESLDEITLTTNGQLLRRKAAALRAAGLSRVNVSLDTLDPRRFAELTRGGSVPRTLDGIKAAVESGLTPVRINVIAQRGLNEQELPDIAAWGLSQGCVVRFLELMPLGPVTQVAGDLLVPASEVLERLGRRFTLHEIPDHTGQPSRDYMITGAGLRGVVGVIAATTRPFCSCCRRLRVTSRGLLVTCLHSNLHDDLSPFWDGQALDCSGADALLARAVAAKPAAGPRAQSLTMLSLGG